MDDRRDAPGRRRRRPGPVPARNRGALRLPDGHGRGRPERRLPGVPADAGSWTSLGADTTDPYGLDWDTTLLADGLYDLRIVVTDGVGNSSPSAVVEDRVVDNTAPGATMNDPGPNLSGTVALTAGATDAGSGVATVAFERSAAGAGAWTPVAASWNTTSVADGLYDLRVTVTDSAGNSDFVAGREPPRRQHEAEPHGLDPRRRLDPHLGRVTPGRGQRGRRRPRRRDD